MLPLAKKSQNDEIKLVLASGSARRKWILENAGFKFTCVTSNFPEDLEKSQFVNAIEYVRATCLGKINALAVPFDELVIQVACDTVLVTPEGKILEKPADWDEAFSMIKGMLGLQIRVISVVHLRRNCKIHCFAEESNFVLWDREEISDTDISGYLESVNYRDLAGGLAVQSCGMVLFKSIQGCYYNVMGFPISKFYQELKEFMN